MAALLCCQVPCKAFVKRSGVVLSLKRSLPQSSPFSACHQVSFRLPITKEGNGRYCFLIRKKGTIEMQQTVDRAGGRSSLVCSSSLLFLVSVRTGALKPELWRLCMTSTYAIHERSYNSHTMFAPALETSYELLRGIRTMDEGRRSLCGVAPCVVLMLDQ